MEIDPQKSLHAAFLHLDTFSVPGIGTFVRRHIPARIHPETRTIDPPRQRFALETGEAYVARLEDFFLRHYQLTLDKARDMVSQVRSWMVRDLKGKGQLELEGIGVLSLVGGKELKFKPAADAGTFPNPFFGLQAIDIQPGLQVGRAPKKQPVAAKKQASAEATEPKKAAAAAAVATKAPEKKTTPPKAKTKKKKRSGLWIIPIIILLFLGVMGVAFHKEISHQLVEWGWMEPGRAVVASSDGNDEEAADSNGEAEEGSSVSGQDLDSFVPDTGGDGNENATGDAANESGDDGNETADAVVEVEVDESGEGDDLKVGSFAEAGKYYLVVSSTHDAREALEAARASGGKVIRPRGKAFYKVYIFSSTNKSDVIAEMVARKNDFSSSWIYWMGM